MMSSRLLRTFQNSKPLLGKLTTGAIVTATIVPVFYGIANFNQPFTPPVAFMDSSSARAKLTQEELESLREELKKELLESSREVKEAVKEAKEEVREVAKEVDGIVGMAITCAMGLTAGILGLVGSLISSIEFDEKVQSGSIVTGMSDGDSIETYPSGVEYRKSVAGAETIKYPDGYVYKKSVAGAVEITGPNGYYYKKSVAGSITERGICNSRFEMGKRY